MALSLSVNCCMKKKQQKMSSLRDFLALLEGRGEVLYIDAPVSVVHEMTELHRRVLEAGGPVLVFRNPVLSNGKAGKVPVVVNLFGTRERVSLALGLGRGMTPADMGQWMSSLRQPEPPSGMGDIMRRLPLLRDAMDMRSVRVTQAPVQEIAVTGKKINLYELPVQNFWPGEPAPLISFPVVVTSEPDCGDDATRYNLGIYRMQLIGKDRLIARWLPQRGGARHHRLWREQGHDMPVAAVIGADPATILSAVTPVPDSVSEYCFSGLVRGAPAQLVRAKTVPLLVPAHAEMVIEGYVSATEKAAEGPYCDHTGYLNSVEDFPVFRVTAITRRRDPFYLSTYLSRPPDEASIMAAVLNDMFLPLMQQQFPEIVDCYLPPEACSYRIAIISIRKTYPGQARRVMMGMWSFLYQFSYTKMIIVVDEDVNVRNWDDVLWALSTRMDSSRDVCLMNNTPVDYLDFASPASGLGGKIGFDATNKIGSETQRVWGRQVEMPENIRQRVDLLWQELGIERRAA